MHLDLPSSQRLVFDQYGRPDAAPVILLHGLSSDRRTWEGVVHHLTTRYVDQGQIQVLALDQRGHGESGRADREHYDAHSYAADLAGLIESLELNLMADPRAVVVGHSLGGVVGAALAATRPELIRGLFLEDPPIFEGDANRRAASPAAKFFPALIATVRQLQASGADPEAFRPVVEATSAPDEVEGRCQSLYRWDPTTMEAAVDGIVWRDFDPDVTLACPVTVVRADPAVGAVFSPGDAERFAAANPEADIIEVPGASHSVHATATLSPYLRHLDVFLVNL